MMMTNGSNIRKTIEKLIYDGTARSGRAMEDSADLFIDNLFRRTTEDHSGIIEEISRRNINWLVHFTPASNVSGILKYGLIPRNYLEKKPLCDIIESIFPDDQRLDGMNESNCISVSFPNYKLFYLKRSQLGHNWAIIMINPEILCHCPCIFFSDNAASSITGNHSPQGFNNMFEDVPIHTPPHSLRNYLKLPQNFTTNPQAEILLNSVIPPKYILAAYVEKWPAKIFIEMKCGNKHREKIWVSNKYFMPRHDYHYWQTNQKS